MRDQALFLLACLAPGLAPAEVLSSSATGFVLEQRIEAPVSPERSWQALVGEVDAWWPRDHTWWGAASTLSIEPRAGGCFCEHAGARSAEHLRVVFVDAPNRLRLLGGLGPLQGMGLQGSLEFDIAPRDDGGSTIRMRYTLGGYSATDLSEFAPVVDRVQGQQLEGLRAHLEAEG
ncbi:hypothetical protein [Aquimonas voraii]|uniref:Uncharacterized conserved protein YndB, AHSA1/START domain n=1 Tax=Aquimonas voraii TaxID=265719 RepID=A0A1G6RXU8_9GAMM|nr:hypothetical protein [Aquimonas voraii]SDD09408.1 Uncharacterized conserved protein YndB, AHSA1/START domain [Aquimonas voraii]